MKLVRTDSSNKDYQELVRLLDQGLTVTDGNEFEFFAQYNKIDMIKHVIVAYADDKAVGGGAIKEYDGERAEIKRMFVRPEFRGQGIAAEILSALEAWAKELGYKGTILETGCMLTSAIRLYERSGYSRIDYYGQYIGVATSVCMEKEL